MPEVMQVPIFAPTTKTVMLCGSQAWLALQSGAVYKFVDALFADLTKKGIGILVGDNPLGVDAHVHQIAYARRVLIKVYGIDAKPRSPRAQTSPYCVYEQVIVPRYEQKKERFGARDIAILRDSDHALCIWNGNSSGTRRIFEAALVYGKPTDMAIWHIEEQCLTWTRSSYSRG